MPLSVLLKYMDGEIVYKQIIIARKDLDMSPGKLAAQVSHGSMAFLTTMIRNNSYPCDAFGINIPRNDADEYRATLKFDCMLYEQWIEGSFTKCVLKAKNKNQLMKAKTMAEELGLKENVDFFLIRDNCMTELEPEEDGRTLTCIGFRPLPAETIDKIGKKYQLYG